ncbi:MAG: 4Fe-4S binding protein [Kiritimatiellae bacterium]|nr:4Fe-4S binding protein [Kiritimatiellia bacterium]
MNKTTPITTAADLEAARQRGRDKLYPDRLKIAVGTATCGLATGAGKVLAALEERLKTAHPEILLGTCGCLGYCQVEPLISVHRPGAPKLIYKQVTVEKVDDFLRSALDGEAAPEGALCRMDREELIVEDGWQTFVDGKSDPWAGVPRYDEVPFFAKQKHIVLRNCGFIDSDDIEEYFGRSGYRALLQTLTGRSPKEVIAEVKESGLRGRGGGGFPTGMKWEFCHAAEGAEKYIICNADEGDPGAYMDRSVLEGDPHSVLEGMLIGAYAIGARHGIIYVRTEYPLAIRKLRRAIRQAQDYGLLGERVMGTGFDFDISIVEGSGAFVCGEETSLIASIEGRPPEPRPRPPFPAHSGLWGKPTNINNVETWANIPVILARGGKWYATMGTEKSKGTKVFSLVGAVNNTGLVEVPMGTSLREIVYEIGGGVANGRALKAVQTGGPSGGCIPAEIVEMPVDYENLAKVGSIMGSGGMVVMDDTNCMVDIARYFTSFTREESCGKCLSCRDGLDAAYRILTRITEGGGAPSDLQLLDELSRAIRDASECGLGKTAPNPVLSTLEFFRKEYEAHVSEKRCPAGVCKALVRYEVLPDACTKCGACFKKCPVQAIRWEKGQVAEIDQAICVKCGVCMQTCRFEAITRT